jgi:hypothetical protein
VRLCADVPELAAETIGCDIERVSPAILRAAAGVHLRCAKAPWKSSKLAG